MGEVGSDWYELKRAARSAYDVGLYSQAAKLYRQARRVAEDAGDEMRRVYCLGWEGDALSLAGEDDAAIPLLLRVTQATAPEVDPVDIFRATTTVIGLARHRRPVAFSRSLIQDAWTSLERMGRENWGHRLHYLQGKLDSARGDFASALRVQRRGWETWGLAGPSFVAAAHLFELCLCSFSLRDHEELTWWVQQIDANPTELEEDHIKAQLARLWLLRASGKHSIQLAVATETVRSTLRRLETLEVPQLFVKLWVFRALAVFGDHADVEHQLPKLPEPQTQNEAFNLALLQIDFALCQARDRLGMEARDDEWDVEFPLPEPPFPDRDAALRHLDDAVKHLEEARPIAHDEDERLETKHYNQTLDSRHERLQALRQSIEETP